MKDETNFWLENGSPKQELKIGMVLDDYKLNNRSEWWVKSISSTFPPEFNRLYEFVREEIGAGVSNNTVSIYRWYRLRASV